MSRVNAKNTYIHVYTSEHTLSSSLELRRDLMRESSEATRWRSASSSREVRAMRDDAVSCNSFAWSTSLEYSPATGGDSPGESPIGWWWRPINRCKIWDLTGELEKILRFPYYYFIETIAVNWGVLFYGKMGGEGFRFQRMGSGLQVSGRCYLFILFFIFSSPEIHNFSWENY